MIYHPELIIEEEENVYPPLEDSILLIESLDIKKGERIIEIGCGSGVVSIHCAINGGIVTSVDINLLAVRCTRRNAWLNGVDINVYWSNLFENVYGVFDTIVFNLPYLPVDDEGELAKAWSGGKDGIDSLSNLMSECSKYLDSGGRVVVVVSSLMNQEKLISLLSKYKVRKKGELPLFFERLEVLEIIP
ncbi:MAG: methyltransferase [archaeon]|nr:methyltransferase [archaeon]